MDPIRKNCWLLLRFSLKDLTSEVDPGHEELSMTPAFELTCDKITAHRTHGEAAEAAGLAVMYDRAQHLSSYIILEASELQINLHTRAPRESDEQADCECSEPMTFGMSQTCLRCGGFVPSDNTHQHRFQQDEDTEEGED